MARKRQVSNVGSVRTSKKSNVLKPKFSRETQPIVLIEKIDEHFSEKSTNKQQNDTKTSNVLKTDTDICPNFERSSKTAAKPFALDEKIKNSVIKSKDCLTSINEASSSKNSDSRRVSRYGRKIKLLCKDGNDVKTEKHLISSQENYQMNSITSSNDNSLEPSHTTEDEIINSKVEENIETLPLVNQKITKKINVDIKSSSSIETHAVSSLNDGWNEIVSCLGDRIEILNTEKYFLECVLKLRKSLQTNSADCDKAISLLKKLIKLPFTSLMLKKHTDVIMSIQKITRYTGNAQGWNLNKQETARLAKKANKIRIKANKLLNKCKSMFVVSDNQNFEEAFKKELNEFYTKTKNMSRDQLFSLTELL